MLEAGSTDDAVERMVDSDLIQLQSMPCDTQLVIAHIQSMAKDYHGFVLQHQLYTNDVNQSIIDEELHQIRHNICKYKFLSCKFTKSISHSLALIEIGNYIDSLHKFIRPFDESEEEKQKVSNLCTKFSRWIRNSSQISMLRRDLKRVNVCDTELGSDGVTVESMVPEDATLTDDEVDRLVQTGFLQYRSCIDVTGELMAARSADADDSEVFWLAHPSLRPLIRCLESVQLEILALIRQNRYKEISEKKLHVRVSSLNQHRTVGSAKRPRGGYKCDVLSSSPFPLSYHLMDLLGRGVLYRVPAPATKDYILRIKI